MAELPEIAPADADHITCSDSIISEVTYQPGRIEYTTFEARGIETVRITFRPRIVLAEGRLLTPKEWACGEYSGVPGGLRIHRRAARHIVVSAEEDGGT
jgi:hypothetical protein